MMRTADPRNSDMVWLRAGSPAGGCSRQENDLFQVVSILTKSTSIDLLMT